MGFNEYDRIRNKNADHNAAYELYTQLKENGMSDGDIAEYVLANDHIRKEILSSVLSIVGRPNETMVVNSSSSVNPKLL